MDFTPGGQAIDKPNITKLLKRDHDRFTGKTPAATNLWQHKLVVVGSAETGNDFLIWARRPSTRDQPDGQTLEHCELRDHGTVYSSQLTPMRKLLLITVMGAAAAFLTWKLRLLASFLGCGFSDRLRGAQLVFIRAIPLLGAARPARRWRHAGPVHLPGDLSGGF